MVTRRGWVDEEEEEGNMFGCEPLVSVMI